ncbi:SDR family NAD(P)-dependent oxidoreductase [Leuconostoc gelidum]|uniref:SDR family NAD(P)-dependent oxidoreductase n=1 Tax=Leuconostoc gelidum TaxID=1244 RepID=UPI001CC35A90
MTGGSTGFRRKLIEELLLSPKYIVIATARSLKSFNDLIASNSNNFLQLKLDVTNTKQIASVVSSTLQKFEKIDVLVNSAGYGYCGSIEGKLTHCIIFLRH